MKHHVHRNQYHTKQGLIDLLTHVPDGIEMIEIGSWAGESASIWAESGKFTKIYCIDPWNSGKCKGRDPSVVQRQTEVEEEFDQTVARYDNIVKLKGFSYDIMPTLPKVGFIYIDGDHEYTEVKKDILLSKDHLIAPGILAGHDFNDPRTPGVTKAVKEIFEKPDLIFKDHSWIKFITIGEKND